MFGRRACAGQAVNVVVTALRHHSSAPRLYVPLMPRRAP
jgi:hypothetical protein